MVLWKGLSSCVDEVYRGWMASTMACCAPRSSTREPQSASGQENRSSNEKTMEICYDQPRLVPAPRPEPRHQRSASHSSTLTLASKWMDRSRSLASRASGQGSVLLRESIGPRPRRPTIGAPSDFRRVEPDLARPRTEGYRPLELSIYLPRNRLSPLPDFYSPTTDGPADPDMPAPPLPVVVRTTSILSLPSSEYRIARKPIGSSSDLGWHARTHQSFDALSAASGLGTDWVVHPLRPRPSLPAALNSHGPTSTVYKQLPKPPPTVRSQSHTEPIHAAGRRDSDPFRARHTGPSKHQRSSSGFLSISTMRTGDMNALGAYDEDLPRRPSTSMLDRPHPLKSPSSHASLQGPTMVRLRESPARSSAPVHIRQAGREANATPLHQPQAAKWLFPIPPPKDDRRAVAAVAEAHVSHDAANTSHPSSSPPPVAPSRTRSSTSSTLATRSTWEDPPTPATVTPQSSPDRRPAIFRQRTFGCGEVMAAHGAGPIMPIKELQVGHEPVWPVVDVVDDHAIEAAQAPVAKRISVHVPVSDASLSHPTNAAVAVGVAF